jgi:hypothetical protein
VLLLKTNILAFNKPGKSGHALNIGQFKKITLSNIYSWSCFDLIISVMTLELMHTLEPDCQKLALRVRTASLHPTVL